MPLVQTSSGKSFSADDGESLLEAALRANVAMAYSCRTGRCSSCKSQVRKGTTIATHDELGLSPSEREAGWILACVRSAASDVHLDVEDLGDAAAGTLPCRIQSLEQVAPDVLKAQLRLPPTSEFGYLPGPYIVIGNDGVRRSYSIANAPGADKHIELHIRQVPSGAMSNYWFGQAKVNDLLRLNGPLGTFFLRKVEDVDLVFLATGTGMAPVKAMLEDLAQTARDTSRQAQSVSVYWGARVPQDLHWRPDTARRVTPTCRCCRVPTLRGLAYAATRNKRCSASHATGRAPRCMPAAPTS